MTDNSLITSLRQKATPEENALLDKYLLKFKPQTVLECQNWEDVFFMYNAITWNFKDIPSEYLQVFEKENWSYNRLKLANKVFNGDWVADIKDGSQPKCIPQFCIEDDVFQLFGSYIWYTASSFYPFSYKSQELAEHAGKILLPEYRHFLIGK